MAKVRPIQFGIALYQERVTWEELKEAYLLVEELGFDTVWCHDHFIPSDPGFREGPCLEGWTILSAVAAMTSRIRLGCFVSGVTYRHPAVLAKMATTVDIISGGRLIFGIGAAWYEEEHTAYGIPFYTLPERIRRLDEAVELMKTLWTVQNLCNFYGKYYQLKDAPFDPKPIQKPHPPIMVAGSGEKLTLRVVAKWADIMNVVGSPETARRKISVLEEHCRAVGRNPDEIEKTVFLYLALPESGPPLDKLLEAWASESGITLEEARGCVLTGTFEEMSQHLQEFVDVGITHFIMPMGAPYNFKALEGFVREVVSAFR